MEHRKLVSELKPSKPRQQIFAFVLSFFLFVLFAVHKLHSAMCMSFAIIYIFVMLFGLFHLRQSGMKNILTNYFNIKTER